MKTKVASLVLIALLFTVGWANSAQKDAPKKVWEYTSTNNYGDLNKLGAEGWEMVGVSDSVSISSGHGSTTQTYFFKRSR